MKWLGLKGLVLLGEVLVMRCDKKKRGGENIWVELGDFYIVVIFYRGVVVYLGVIVKLWIFDDNFGEMNVLGGLDGVRDDVDVGVEVKDEVGVVFVEDNVVVCEKNFVGSGDNR